MKKLFILTFILAISSCQEENDAPTGSINDGFDTSKATLIKSGSFTGVGHSVSGKAAVYDSSGKKIVLLEPFMSQNGPDLKVYLSKDQNASEYISLGKMKSTSGKQSYEVPDNVNVADYSYVLIWCQQFSVLFGKAQLL